MRTPAPRRRSMVATLALTAGLVAVPVVVAAPASAACGLPLPLPIPIPFGSPTATTPPTITGEAKVGKTVTATPPVWDTAGTTTTYQWLRNGEAIEGATEATYLLTGDDFDQQIVVRASGAGGSACLTPGQSDSALVEPALGDPIEPTSAPVVSGSSAVGGTLTTTDGQWGAPEPLFTYQWYRSRASGKGAEAIPGATTKTYSPVTGDSGRKLVAVVIADRVGYEKGAGLSNVITVPKVASTAVLSLPRSTVRKSQAPSVRVVLTSSIGVVPTGVIAIYDGSRKVRSIKISSAANGAVTFQIARQTVGKHNLTARYLGDTAHQATISNVQVLTVTK